MLSVPRRGNRTKGHVCGDRRAACQLEAEEEGTGSLHSPDFEPNAVAGPSQASPQSDCRNTSSAFLSARLSLEKRSVTSSASP